MIAFTVPILAVLLVTSQFINAYPSASAIDGSNNHPTNLRLKRAYGLAQHHDLANNFNDDLPLSINEYYPFGFGSISRQNRKRLIDF